MTDDSVKYDDLDFEIIYHEGDKVRRLRGHVHDVDCAKFVKVSGLNKMFYINPAFIERIEQKMDAASPIVRKGAFMDRIPEMAAKRADFLIEQLGDSAEEMDRQTQIKQGMTLRELIIKKESEKLASRGNLNGLDFESEDGNQ